MASVTQTIPNFLGGVSNQPDDKKLPGQVTESLNSYPDPTFGLTKRPGFKYLDTLAETTGGTAFDNNDLDTGKWFYVNRDTDEKYVGCIVGNATANDAAIHIWNADDIDANGNCTKCTVNYGTNARNYLNSTIATDYNFINVRDTSIITNKTKVVTAVTDTFNPKRQATIRIHLAEYSSKYEVKITKSGGTSTFTVNTRAGDTATNDADTSNFLNGIEIITALKTLIDAASVVDTVHLIGTSLELVHSADFTLEVRGGRVGTALTAYQDDVDGISELPSASLHNRVVGIKNTFAAEATHFAKFIATNGTSGLGIWEETIAPGVDKGLSSATMPHKLRNADKNEFVFEVIEEGTAGVFGTPRLVGDDTTNPHPSFKGATIQQAFYYNNRLGFLTKDNVSMGQAADYFNFYSESAKTATAADPIDLSCSSIKDVTLHGIVPSPQGLILFSNNQQFLMYSADGNLSPQTALIRGISNYQMDTKVDPVDVGTHINFISKTHTTAGFTRIFAMQPQGGQQLPQVLDVGRVVSKYVPATIDRLLVSPQNSFIAMCGKTEDKIYFYRTYSAGDRDLFQSWFKWQLPGNVHFVEVDSDTMYSVVKTGTGGSARYTLLSATMTQTPEETIIVNSEGDQLNPHMDFYTAATNGLTGGSKKTVVYDATNDFSKCYIPYPDVTTLDPVILISGDVQNFAGATESGWTITPTRASDSDGTYFKVPLKDLSSQAANVFVGYKYNYDITLPKIYFNKGQQGMSADYTANLTIARMKFSVGQSSVVGFKVKSKGFVGDTVEYTGNGVTQNNGSVTGTTQFSPPFRVEDKGDIKVKVDGAVQDLGTNYTIADHADLSKYVTVTFTSAPLGAVTAGNKTTAAQKIEIYIDNWFDLQPTQDFDYYLANDVPLVSQSLFTVPIHQRPENYSLRVFSSSPFPVALTSMTWEGNYSPRYYRRT